VTAQSSSACGYNDVRSGLLDDLFTVFAFTLFLLINSSDIERLRE